MKFPVTWPKKCQRSDFDPVGIQCALLTKGQRAWWEKAEPCVCTAANNGIPDGSCQICGGTGRVYVDGEEVRLIVESVEIEPRLYERFGQWVLGTVRLTLRPEHLPGYLDRFTLLDAVMVVRESAMRKGSVQRLKYPIAIRSMRLLKDGQEQQVDVGVLYLAKSDGTKLEPGVDFAVTEDGAINWGPGDQAGTAPAEGEGFVVSYYAHPGYVVTEYPHASRVTYTKLKGTQERVQYLPVQVLARLEYQEANA